MTKTVKAWTIKYKKQILPNWTEVNRKSLADELRAHGFMLDGAKIIRVEIREIPKKRGRK